MNRDAYRTPPELFAALNAEFNFQGDIASSSENTLCDHYLTENDNALVRGWVDFGCWGDDYVWCNPPYSDICPWVHKAAEQAKLGVGCVMLVMADTSVGWYAEAIKTCQEVRFIVGGRISFLNPETGKPAAGNNKGSLLLIWRPYCRGTLQVSHIQRDKLLENGRKIIAMKHNFNEA